MILRNINKNTRIMIVTIFLIFIFWSLFTIKAVAKGIPNSKCEWHYIGESIVTSCGYKIVDGCPKCGREIYVYISEEENIEK